MSGANKPDWSAGLLREAGRDAYSASWGLELGHLLRQPGGARRLAKAQLSQNKTVAATYAASGSQAPVSPDTEEA